MTQEDQPRCERFRDAMWLYMSRELPEEELAQWEDHLAKCERCRRRLQQASRALDAFDRAPKP